MISMHLANIQINDPLKYFILIQIDVDIWLS